MCKKGYKFFKECIPNGNYSFTMMFYRNVSCDLHICPNIGKEAEIKIDNLLEESIMKQKKNIITGNRMIDVMLNMGLLKCNEKNIDCRINVFIGLDGYDEQDLCIIIFNLFCHFFCILGSENELLGNIY